MSTNRETLPEEYLALSIPDLVATVNQLRQRVHEEWMLCEGNEITDAYADAQRQHYLAERVRLQRVAEALRKQPMP